MKNKHDIRDQHGKIHQKLYFSSQNISIKIFALLPLRLLLGKFWPVPPYRRNFHGKYFMMKNKFFGVFFHADSEYDTYFPQKTTFDNRNLEKLAVLWDILLHELYLFRSLKHTNKD